MLHVGITGGIAAGKSVATARFGELGVLVIDYDQLAREVVAPGTRGLERVVEAFGEGVLAPDGTLDRSGLAHIVFYDDEARERLEEIIHPLVIARGQELDAEAEARGATMVVHSIPLLVEAAGPEVFDVVIVVDAPPDVRAARLVSSRALSEDEAWARIDAQTDDDVRLAAADVVFDGSGTPDNLRAQVDAWVEDVRANGVTYRPNPERGKFLITEDCLP